MKVICIGSTSKDIFFPTNDGQIVDTPEDLASQKKFIFELGAKYHISNRFESLGGCAANQACGLARLGISTSCYTSIGDDVIGKWITEELLKEKVEQELVVIEPDCLSGLSAIVVDEKSADRIIFSNQEANEKLEIIPEKIKDADFISVTDLSGDWKKDLDEIMKVGIENDIRIAFNPREKNIKDDSQKISEIAKNLEILFLNKDEAIEILLSLKIETSGDEKELIGKIKNFGSKVVVITDGMNGAWGFDGENIFHVEALKENAVDSTGAGDAFSSGFMSAYLKEKSLEECLKWGIANGGNVVNFYGGVSGLLREEEMLEKIKKIKTEKI